MDLLVNHPHYSDLVSALDASGGWRALAEIGDEFCTVLTAADLAQAERRPSPARFLLDRLSEQFDQPLTTEETVDLLQGVGGPAAEAAELLLPPRPLAVRPLAETNSARVWVPLGGRLLLRCEADARPPPAFLWQHDGAPLAGGTAAELCVQPFAVEHAGRYTCEVRDASGAAVDAGAVRVQPTQTPPRQTGRAADGGALAADGAVAARGDRALSLSVEWVGWPPPQFRWERDGLPLAGCDGQALTLQPGPELVDGRYVCLAANDVGEVCSEPFLVELDQRPVILSQPQAGQRRHPIGRQLTLRCSAFCRRPLKVTWRLSVEEQGQYEQVLRDVRTERTADGVEHSEVWLTPTEAEARHECLVTCEFVADGDYDNSYTRSQPARFRVVYAAHSKMALIIGNAYYSHLFELQEVNRDVADFCKAIRELGFSTLVARNLSTERSRRVVEYFARAAAPGAYLVVLVAGHGFTHQRQDYLVPVDHPAVEGSHGADPGRCLPMLDYLERRLQHCSPRVLLLCGDMCRTTNAVPPPTSPAAAPQPAAPTRSSPNVVRLFSTQMGHEAMDDGRFMKHLLRNIQQDITVQQLGLRTLGDISGSSTAAAQSAQHPIVEMSMADRRSLLDTADHTTALDVRVTRQHIIDSNSGMSLEESWSNYVWDGQPEMLLTLRLSDAPDGFFVRLVRQNTKDGQLVFRLESGDWTSPVSTWRVTHVPAVAGCVTLRPVFVLFASPSQHMDRGFLLPELQLRFGPLGLVDSPEPAQLDGTRQPHGAGDEHERKVSNVADGHW